jgi:hypothetical protein
MRNSLLGTWGAAGVIPSVPVTGTVYTTSGSLALDTAYRDEHLTLVAFVSSYGATKADKFVLNANEIRVTNNFATQISAPETDVVSLDVYPVPSAGIVYLNYSLKTETSLNISIVDITGREVKSIFSGTKQAGAHTESCNIAALAKGIYGICVKDSRARNVKRLVIQ